VRTTSGNRHCDCLFHAIVPRDNFHTLMGLLRTLLWIGLFLVSTFAFTVLFEYGTGNFADNSRKEWDSLIAYFQKAREGTPPKKTP